MGPVMKNLTYVMEGNYGLMLSKMIHNQPNRSWRIFIYDIKEGGKWLMDVGVTSKLGQNIGSVTHKPLYVIEGNYGLMLSKMIQKQPNRSWRIF